MDFTSKEHLKEELLAVCNRKTSKWFVENVNEDLSDQQQIDPDQSIREVLRSLMLVSLDVLVENFIITFEDDYQGDSNDEEE